MSIYTSVAHLLYLLSISLFIIGIKSLSKVKTARAGNLYAALGMFLAVVGQLLELHHIPLGYIISGVLVGSAIGILMAKLVKMTAMPEMVAVFNGFGGAASMLVALAIPLAVPDSVYLASTEIMGTRGVGVALAVVLSIVIGAVTFSGSIAAYLKLSGVLGSAFDKPVLLPARHILSLLVLLVIAVVSVLWIGIDIPTDPWALAFVLVMASLLLGILVVIPIGGADMPVVISLLNSYSGLAGSAAGFVLNSPILIVSGALVGASGMILTNIMCRGMNRTLLNVMIGGFGGESASGGDQSGYSNIKSSDPEEAAMDFAAVRSVIIIPGYGLAVAQAQGALAEFGEHLKQRGCSVKYAIHPVAGRMPGHMNVLLAEAQIPYDELFEMDDINKEFANTDIAFVVGANDVVNPSAKEDKTSPLYGMPVLAAEQARLCFVIKRSMSPGFAGIKNTLFEKDNCRMIFGDAKKVLVELAEHLSAE